MPALLELDRIQLVGQGAWLLRDVSLRVEEGSTVALIGGAAAGKSLLLAIAMGQLAPRSGAVRFDGRDVTSLDARERHRLGLGMAYQTPPFFPGFDVREHLELAAAGGRLEPRQLQKLLDFLPELEGSLEHPVDSLDQPTRRLVDVARALLGLPRLLLVDQLFPVVGVDRAGALVERLAREGFSLLIADRYGEVAMRHADYGYVLTGGRIQDEGAAADLAQDERLLAACAGDPAAYSDH